MVCRGKVRHIGSNTGNSQYLSLILTSFYSVNDFLLGVNNRVLSLLVTDINNFVYLPLTKVAKCESNTFLRVFTTCSSIKDTVYIFYY